MTRLTLPGLLLLGLTTGCTTTDDTWTIGEWSVKRALGWEEVQTPSLKQYPQASLPIAERVDSLGRRIIAQNTFSGIEPMFWAIGVPEPMLFHKGYNELYISEGLVKQCKTEAELAAVLCSELGQMIAERQAARRVSAERDSIPEVGLPGGTAIATSGGTPDDPGRAAERAYQEKRAKAQQPTRGEDARQLARGLMRGAGFDPAELERIEPLLKQSERGKALQKQLTGTAPAPPRWEK
jgi:predicted Zn-dependent protease